MERGVFKEREKAKMILFPAIDIKDGRCVRLVQGDYATAHQVAEDPLQTAQSFQRAGAKWIHMVDLDGAKDAKQVNREIFLQVARETRLKVEVGGGIRTMRAVKDYLDHGVARVILGSAALKDPDFVRRAVEEYGDRIAVGIDARNGYVAAEGWLDVSQVFYLDFARAMEEAGVKTIIFTDISKDGTLAGPNLEQLAALQSAVSCQIIASGGVGNLADLQKLADLKLYGAICGKALYQGTVDLAKAVRLFQVEDLCTSGR